MCNTQLVSLHNKLWLICLVLVTAVT